MKRWFKNHFAYLPSRNSLFILFLDVFFLFMAYLSAFLLRFNFLIKPFDWTIYFKQSVIIVLLVKLFLFYFYNLYRGMWRYTGIVDLVNLVKAATLSAFIITFLIFQLHIFSPRSIIVIDWCLTIILIGGVRFFIRWYFWQNTNDDEEGFGTWVQLLNLVRTNPKSKRLLIIGAGDSGEKILREIKANNKMNYQPVGFLDDDDRKFNKLLHGVPVLGDTSLITEVSNNYGIDEILIAIPFATNKKMRQIVEDCKKAGVSFRTIPTLTEIIDGKISINTVREIAYRDLLGREPVKLEQKRIEEYLFQKTVLVTGAAGSIGSELCRQVARFQPFKIILLERAESPLYDLEFELRHLFPSLTIVPVLGDIQDTQDLFRCFSLYHPEVVFHAAAYKHVPMMEIHPWEAIKNNIGGTRSVIQMAERFRVERFVLVSTDKAVNPISIMGATKKVAEMMVQFYASRTQKKTKYMVVRFGNVLGSVGSVVPLFKKQISEGGPVTVTHPEMTRYFMSIQEASQLILQAGAMGQGGEIFVLNMGKPIKILEIAEDIIRLSGFEPNEDIKIEFIGLRPGEKLHEELVSQKEEVVITEHEKIFIIRAPQHSFEKLEEQVENISNICHLQDKKIIREHLRNIIGSEYNPRFSAQTPIQGKYYNQGYKIAN